MIRLLAALLAVSLASMSQAAPREETGIAGLMAKEQQLYATGWRLAAANAPFCAGSAPALGMQTIDTRTFKKPLEAQRQLGLVGEVGIGTTGPDSPAQKAGLARGDTIVAIDGTAVAKRFPPTKPSWQRPLAIAAALAETAGRGPVTLTVVNRRDAGQRTVSLAPVMACPSLFQVFGKGAGADGSRVRFGEDFPGFGYPEGEFAAAVAHEFAHNLLGHRELLDAKGRSLGNVRLTEREADRLMPWLLANAGYDPDAALTFMQRWGPRHDGGLFRNRNHEGWDERAEAIAAEIEGMKPLIAAEGRADWARHFVREVLD